MTELLKELIEFIKDASPQLWAILIKQVYVEAVSFLIWGIVLSVSVYFLVKFSNYCREQHKKDKYEMWDAGAVLTCIVSIIAAPAALSFLISAMKWFSNPEFYAIRYILQQLGN